MPRRILIIKLGASGDVVRTTPLLRALDGQVTWVTSATNTVLLPADHPRMERAIPFDHAAAELSGERFDLVISLDDEEEAAALASSVDAAELVGAYLDDDGAVVYTDSSAQWFDMGLVSRFGKARADEIKMENTRTYQEILFAMVGLRFANEEYLLRAPQRRERRANLVGIEARAGDRWPTKRWHRFEDLAAALRASGYDVRFFEQRDTLEEYVADIDECALVVTGDSLALHVATALRVPVVAIFTCTSATEIHGYGRMEKVVSPRLGDAFYRTEYVPEAVEAIALGDVTAAMGRLGFDLTRSPSDAPAPASSVVPLVYVILVNWNGRDDTIACLDSLAAVDYARFDVVLVDNASADGSVAAVRAQFPDVTVIENERNEMFARANNQGIEMARARGADFVLLLNNDTEVAPDLLTRMVAAARADDAIGMVGPKIYFFDPADVLWYAGGIVNLWKGLIAHRGIRQRDAGQFDTPGDTGYITACSVLVSRACLEVIGGLDDDYYIYGEDVDWCERARRAGFRLVYEPSARVWHKVSSSSGGKEVAGGLTPFKVVHKTRSMFRFFRRYARWYQWPSILLFTAGYAIKAAVFMIGAGNWSGLRAMFASVFSRKRS